MILKKIIFGLATLILFSLSVGGLWHYYKIEHTKRNGRYIYVKVLDKIRKGGSKPKRILCLAFGKGIKLETRDSKTLNVSEPGKYARFKYSKDWGLIVAENEPTYGAFILLIGIFIISLKSIHIFLTNSYVPKNLEGN